LESRNTSSAARVFLYANFSIHEQKTKNGISASSVHFHKTFLKFIAQSCKHTPKLVK
jgi:hypothetical protein